MMLDSCCFFFFKDTPTTEIYTVGPTLSRHAALPIALAVEHHRRDGFGGKTVSSALALQRAQVAGAAMAEAELRADVYFARRQSADQHGANERLRAHRHHAVVEAQQADQVRAEFAQALELRPRQLQPRRQLAPGEEFARPGFDRESTRLNSRH